MKLKSDGKTCAHPFSSSSTPSPSTTQAPIKTTLKVLETKTQTTPPHNCEYICHSSRVCIKESQVCDGKFDCPEQDDERNCKKVTLNNKSQTTKLEETKSEKDTSNTVIMATVITILVLLLLIIACSYYCRQRRSRADLR